MTAALVFCTEDVEPDPALAYRVDGQTLLERLRAQLNRLGVDRVTVVARPATAARLRAGDVAVYVSRDVAGDLAVIRATAAAHRERDEALVLCSGDLVAHDSALAAAVAPGIRATTALVGPRWRYDAHPPVLRQRGRIIAVGSGYHRVSAPTCALRGLVRVAAADLAALEPATVEVEKFCAERGESADALAGRAGAVGLVVLALTRRGTPVLGHRVRVLFCGRVTDTESLVTATNALAVPDESAVALRLAVKEHDDLFATYCVSSYSPRIVRWAARRGLSPTAVTWLSIALAVAAAAAFGSGTRPLLVLGAALLYAGFVFDCVDGQLARYTHRYSRYGGWLDAVADRAKEYCVYAGLAIGAGRSGVDRVWVLVVAALVLQTVRHMTDAWYGALQDEAVARLSRLSLHRPGDALGTDAPGEGAVERSGGRLTKRLGGALGRVSARLESNRASPGYWFKRTIVFPIGERWLLIALAAALFDGRAALLALLSWGLLAAVYTLSGRTLRARAMRVPAMAARGIGLHRDDGALARALARAGRGRVRPLASALLGFAVAGAFVALATPGLDRLGVDPTAEWPVLVSAGAVLLAATAGRHPHDGALDWLVAAALRAAESLVVVLVGLNDGVPVPLVFALLAVLALFHYDLAARLDKGASPLTGRWLDLGWDGRVALLAAAAAFDLGAPAMAGLAGYLALVFLAGCLVGLVLRGRTGGVTVPAPTRSTAGAAAAARPAAGGDPGGWQVPDGYLMPAGSADRGAGEA